jgi:uncharacterized membrane protein YkoI
MPVLPSLSFAVVLGLLAVLATAPPGLAADAHPRACLSKAEQRAAVAADKAVPLGTAIKSLRRGGPRAEVVRAALCRRGEKLVYVLTLLARNGKVIRATVDATSGEPINGL